MGGGWERFRRARGLEAEAGGKWGLCYILGGPAVFDGRRGR